MNKALDDKIEIFKKEYGFDNCRYNELLTTSMAVGGNVAVLCLPENEEEIIACIKAAAKAELPLYVCGNLSNTIIKDGGFNGVVLRLMDNFSGYEINGNRVKVKSGTPMIKLAKDVTQKGLGGLEFAGGIPGTVGGGVRMNAGAYGGQMSDVVKAVTYYTDGRLVTTDNCGFGYRESIFDAMDDVVIISVEMELEEGKAEMEQLLEFNRRRKEKQPLEKPSCGSVFKRPKEGYASKMIEDCGLKGLRVGGAVVSEKHSGFIVNDGNATAKDVLTLMETVRARVHEQMGVFLNNEWVIIGED